MNQTKLHHLAKHKRYWIQFKTSEIFEIMYSNYGGWCRYQPKGNNFTKIYESDVKEIMLKKEYPEYYL